MAGDAMNQVSPKAPLKVPLILARKEYLAKGKRGIAYTAFLGRKKILIKERNPRADVDTIAHEAVILKAVNKVGVGPVFIALEDNSLIREFIDGPTFPEWCVAAKKPAITRAMIGILEQCRSMDVIGVNKLEMNHPHKHILMKGDAPVMIDFDRSRFVKRPKNVTQVCQWLTGGALSSILKGKNIHLPREELLALAGEYKRDYDAKLFAKMLVVVRGA